MTPAEALEQEMQEVASTSPSSFAGHPAAAAGSPQQQRPHSSNTVNGMSAFRNPYFDSAPGATAADRASVGVRPASVGGAPLVPQHNNLMSPAGSTRPGSTGSSRTSREDYLATQLGLNKLKDKL